MRSLKGMMMMTTMMMKTQANGFMKFKNQMVRNWTIKYSVNLHRIMSDAFPRHNMIYYILKPLAERFFFFLDFSFHFSGQCNPNPCHNNGVCKEKGKKKFKCDCPKPYKGKRCEKGLNAHVFFPNIVVMLQTGNTCMMHNLKKKVHIIHQVKEFVKEVDVGVASAC